VYVFICLVYMCTCTQDDKTKLRKIAINNRSSQMSDDFCVVCMVSIDMNDEGIKLACNHLFHEICIAIFFKYPPTCPSCQAPFNPNILSGYGVFHGIDVYQQATILTQMKMDEKTSRTVIDLTGDVIDLTGDAIDLTNSD